MKPERAAFPSATAAAIALAHLTAASVEQSEQ